MQYEKFEIQDASDLMDGDKIVIIDNSNPLPNFPIGTVCTFKSGSAGRALYIDELPGHLLHASRFAKLSDICPSLEDTKGLEIGDRLILVDNSPPIRNTELKVGNTVIVKNIPTGDVITIEGPHNAFLGIRRFSRPFGYSSQEQKTQSASQDYSINNDGTVEWKRNPVVGEKVICCNTTYDIDLTRNGISIGDILTIYEVFIYPTCSYLKLQKQSGEKVFREMKAKCLKPAGSADGNSFYSQTKTNENGDRTNTAVKVQRQTTRIGQGQEGRGCPVSSCGREARIAVR